MKQVLRLLLLIPVLMSVGCTSLLPTDKPLIPDKTIKLASNLSIRLGDLAAGVVAGLVIQLVYDPLAPNWEIKETQLADDVYHYDLTMKRYQTGGAGESMQVLRRRALQLQYARGFESYQILEYSEGIDSKTLGAQRTAEAVVRMTRRAGAARPDSPKNS